MLANIADRLQLEKQYDQTVPMVTSLPYGTIIMGGREPSNDNYLTIYETIIDRRPLFTREI